MRANGKYHPSINYNTDDPIIASGMIEFKDYWNDYGRRQARRVCDYPDAADRHKVFIGMFLDAYTLGAQSFRGETQSFPQTPPRGWRNKLRNFVKTGLQALISKLDYISPPIIQN